MRNKRQRVMGAIVSVALVLQLMPTAALAEVAGDVDDRQDDEISLVAGDEGDASASTDDSDEAAPPSSPEPLADAPDADVATDGADMAVPAEDNDEATEDEGGAEEDARDTTAPVPTKPEPTVGTEAKTEAKAKSKAEDRAPATKAGGVAAVQAQDDAAGQEPGLEAQAAATATLGVTAHVQDEGWRTEVGSGAVAGSVGMGRRLEALLFTLTGSGLPSGTIECRAHVQDEGWQAWRPAGQVCGSEGAGRRIEAFMIRLSGELASRYDVWYQAHVQDIGWMALAKNGAAAGTTGRALRIEAVRVWLVPSKSAAPADASVGVPYASLGANDLAFRAHVQDIGWMAPVDCGATIGTTGSGRRLEAFSVTSNLDADVSVECRAHVQDEGWQDWRPSGAVVGSTGLGRRVEAVQMRLAGSQAATYDLYYRAHVQNVGWLGWAKASASGVTAGSVGQSLRVEALQARLVAHGAAAPSNADAVLARPSFAAPTITYAAYVQGERWQAARANGATAGTTGRSLRLEGITARVTKDAYTLPGTVTYRAHMQDTGWQDWVAEGGKAGAPGTSRRIESIQMSLTGPLSAAFSVWYRAYVQDVGWLGWARDGEIAGSTGASRRIEAIQVLVISVAGGAPGSTDAHHITGDYFMDEAGRAALGYSSPTGQLIIANLAAHQVSIFFWTDGSWRRVRQFPCSCGAPATPSRRGVFSIGNRGYVFGSGYSCYYWTQYSGDYLFHSVLYNQGTFNIQDGRLGMDISHGCIRLAIDDARFINENIRTGSTVVVY